jgi:hypothetical protein
MIDLIWYNDAMENRFESVHSDGMIPLGDTALMADYIRQKIAITAIDREVGCQGVIDSLQGQTADGLIDSLIGGLNYGVRGLKMGARKTKAQECLREHLMNYEAEADRLFEIGLDWKNASHVFPGDINSPWYETGHELFN